MADNEKSKSGGNEKVIGKLDKSFNREQHRAPQSIEKVVDSHPPQQTPPPRDKDGS